MTLKKINLHFFLQIILFFLLVSFDQIAKTLAYLFLQSYGDINIIGDAIQLHYLENNGAAFGILKDQRWLFYVLTIIILCVVLYLWISLFYKLKRFVSKPHKDIKSAKKTYKNFELLSYLLIILCSGAIGNLIDRLFYGHVIDFIYFKFIEFPVFNIADICVTVSAFLLFIFFIFIYKDNKEIRIFEFNSKQTSKKQTRKH